MIRSEGKRTTRGWRIEPCYSTVILYLTLKNSLTHMI